MIVCGVERVQWRWARNDRLAPRPGNAGRGFGDASVSAAVAPGMLGQASTLVDNMRSELGDEFETAVRARPGRLRALSVSYSKSLLCGAFV
jgi:hypothetical protein